MSDTDRAAATIATAAALLHNGRLVAFPTETVYGLGADATSAAAVGRIFTAKGRPSTNPLIVHVADVSVARRYAATWPIIADRLAEAFWPGPLTIVLPKTAAIVVEAPAGRQTVGLRVPNHPLALELLRAFGGPVAAPSANKSNRVSPTTAAHVRQELGDAVDLVLDGGPCSVGIESTVLDLSTATPTILRPGGISREQIEAVVGRPVATFAGSVAHDVAAVSPGQQLVHYSPQTPAYRFTPSQRNALDTRDAAMMALGTSNDVARRGLHVEMPQSPEAYAQHLYAVLRDLDAMNPPAIYIEMPPDAPAWQAVRDRIGRATRPLP